MDARDRFRHILSSVLRESWPLLIITAALFFIMRNVASTSWEEIFLYNGDSITLPLVLESIDRTEPFEWIFSTQTFFFPEFPIFWLCTLVAGSTRAALMLNAFVNVLLLYGLFRGVTSLVLRRSPLRQVVFALLGVLMLLTAIATERSVYIIPPGIVHPSSIATLFLLTTYYNGVILVAVANLLLVLLVLRARERPGSIRSAAIAYITLVTIIGSLTMYSNPLYALVYFAPLVATLIILLICRLVPLPLFALIIGPAAAAVGIGLLFRAILWRFIASGVDAYIAPDRAWGAYLQLVAVFGGWGGSGTGLLRLFILAVPIVAAIAFVIVSVTRLVRRRGQPSTPKMFVMVFIVVSVSSLLLGQIATGQNLTRYLVPLFVIPLLGILLFGDSEIVDRARGRLHPRLVRAGIAAVAAVGVVASGLCIGYSWKPIAGMAAGEDFDRADCVDEWLDGNDASGVATFWTARSLQLYGNHSGIIVQAVDTVFPHVWMTNLWQFTDREFTFVIAADEVEVESANDHLGAPTEIVQCAGLQILDYAGTPGAVILTQLVSERAEEAIAERHY